MPQNASKKTGDGLIVPFPSRLSPVGLLVLGVLSSTRVYAQDYAVDTTITNETINSSVNFTAPDITIGIDGGSTISGGNAITFAIPAGGNANLNISGTGTTVTGSTNGIYGGNANAQINISDGASVSSDANGVTLSTAGSSLTISGAGTTVSGTNRYGVAVEGGDIAVNVTDGATVSGTTGIAASNPGGTQSAINVDGGNVIGTNGNAINVGTTGSWTGQINVINGSTVTGTTNGVRTDATGSTINVSGQGTTVTGTTNAGVIADAESKSTAINVTDGAIVTGASGIISGGSGSGNSITVDGSTVQGTTANGINVGTTGIWDGLVDVTNGSTVTGATNGIRTDATGTTITVSGAGTTVTGTANSGIIADAQSQNTTINVTDGATVTGATGIINSATDANSSAINVNGGVVNGTNGNGIDIRTAGAWNGQVDISNGATVTGTTNGVRTNATGSTITVSGQGTTINGASNAGIIADTQSINTDINDRWGHGDWRHGYRDQCDGFRQCHQRRWQRSKRHERQRY